MSRFRRVVHSVASGYVALVATAVYSLASVPLALHYLSTERFGLWSLMAGISGYLSLIDLGMSASVSRLLIDHKDDKQSGLYGSLIKTGWLVLAVQAGIILLVGFLLAPMLSNLLAIQPDFAGDFVGVMRWQCAALALGIVTRMFGHVLLAHQRVDITNYAQTLTLALNFVLLWYFFHAGHGVYSLVWSGLAGSTGAIVLMASACTKLGLFPPAGAWGKTSWSQFKEIFRFGTDLFLVAVGYQMLSASPTLIITRQLGLAEAAVWYAGTRAFNLVSLAIWRVSDVSAPAFSEMIVRGEQALLQQRYKAVLMLTASLSGAAAVIYASCNSLFVSVWTSTSHEPIIWPPLNDVLLGIWMLVLAILHCHNGFIMLSKKIAFMRYVYFLEGLVFVVAALGLARWGGLRVIIIISLICSIAFSGAYGIWRIKDYFNLPVRTVAWEWLAPMRRMLYLFVPIAFGIWWLSRAVPDPTVRLALNAFLSASVGLYLFLRYGLSSGFQRELLQRAPRGVNPFLAWVFARAAATKM